MIVGIGLDQVTTSRFAAMLRDSSGRVFERVCTEAERTYCEQQAEPHKALAARWCAKEAVAKCLRTGFANGVTPRSIELVREESGALAVALHGAAATRATELGIARVHVSISHNEDTAIAVAIAEA